MHIRNINNKRTEPKTDAPRLRSLIHTKPEGKMSPPKALFKSKVWLGSRIFSIVNLIVLVPYIPAHIHQCSLPQSDRHTQPVFLRVVRPRGSTHIIHPLLRIVVE